jgi:hypothetical protein
MAVVSCAASATSYNQLAGLDPTGDSVPFSATVRGTVNSLFSDTFGFVIDGSSNIDSGVQSIATLSGKKTFDLDILNFGIHNIGTNQTFTGTMISNGPTDSWTINNLILGVGNYEVVVAGKILGNGGGSYGGNLNVSPVPEPETYLMMLGGLAIVGMAASRRKKAHGDMTV